MLFINEAINGLIETNKRKDIAHTLGVSTALVSTWLQEDNDFCPRVGVASKLYKYYGLIVYPYSDEALQYWLDNNET